nr:uncharacterized protein LOC127323922 [Lolium perenne]
MVEVKPYIKQFTAKYWRYTHRDPTSEESKDIFDKGGGHGFSSWFCGLARTDKDMNPLLRKIARGFNHSVDSFNSYDVNGYQDLSLLEAFKASIDLDPNGPPPGFIDDYWFAEPDDDETCGPITDVDIGY